MAIAEGVAALKSLKSLYDLVDEIKKSNDPERLRAAASQMLDLTLTARAQTAALQDERNAAVMELAALKAEIEQANRFDDEAKHYTRERTHSGATVYREKDAGGPQGQSPYYCPHCFSKKRLSILNPVSPSDLGHTLAYGCPECGTKTLLPKLRVG